MNAHGKPDRHCGRIIKLDMFVASKNTCMDNIRVYRSSEWDRQVIAEIDGLKCGLTDKQTCHYLSI